MLSDTFVPPTTEELRQTAVTFLKSDQAKYRRLRVGELEEIVKLKVEETEWYANSLIAKGEFANQAWSWAIREKILERDPD